MHIELDAWEQNSNLRPKASLHKGCPQRGRPKAASFLEAGFRSEFGVLLPSIQFYMHVMWQVAGAEVKYEFLVPGTRYPLNRTKPH